MGNFFTLTLDLVCHVLPVVPMYVYYFVVLTECRRDKACCICWDFKFLLV